MTSPRIQSSLLFALALLLLFSACSANGGENTEAEIKEEGLVMCCELVAYCHVTVQSTDPLVADCHELGHRNAPSACRDDYDACMAACADANDDPVEHACQ